jgi:hypothetical protein
MAAAKFAPLKHGRNGLYTQLGCIVAQGRGTSFTAVVCYSCSTVVDLVIAKGG